MCVCTTMWNDTEPKFMVDIEMNDESQETNNNRPVTDV